MTGMPTREAYKAQLFLLDPNGDGEIDESERQLQLALERQAQEQIAAPLRKQFRDILPASAAAMSLAELLTYIDVRIANDQAVVDAINRAIQNGADLGVNIALDQLQMSGIGFDYTLVHTAARDWARQYGAQLIRNVNDTTREAVRQSVSRWYENGEPLSALRDDLVSTVFNERRAQLIAMTETTRAAAEGTHIGYAESGVVTEEIWLTANDERVCPYCNSLNEQVVSINGGSFFDRLPDELREQLEQRAARNPNVRFARPPAHPGCRCRIGARVVPVPSRRPQPAR